ncbi:MAG TPA: DinB family protein [Gemmatimonadaceae bacterium]|nr:DinB family protein [Vicinamibacterales bacterium]
MHPQLQEIVDDFEAARRRLHALAGRVPEDVWARRPGPDRWSAAECVAHLNITTEAFRPLVREALARARDVGGPAPARYRRDPTGWLLWKILPPPARMKVKTGAAFVPGSVAPRDQLIASFDRLQDEQIAWVREADGLRIDAVKLPSPFSARAKYNLFACFGILPRHQHRHLWQAEQASGASMDRP